MPSIYASKPHSFFGLLSLIMAGVSLLWLGYLDIFKSINALSHPVWDMFAENALWPGGIAILLALIGLLHPRHKPRMSLITIVVVPIIYYFLSPSFNFA